MKKELKLIVLSTITVLFASILRQFPASSAPFKLFIHIMSMLLILLTIFIWAVQMQQFIIQIQLRRYLGFLSMLMMLWIFLRYSRFYLFGDNFVISRLLWYLYYIPMIFIPLNSFFFSLYFGRSILWKAPNYYKLLDLIGLFFLSLVLFNDKLQLIFIFEDIDDFSNYTYGTTYYLMLLFQIVLILFMLVNLIRKSYNKLNNRKVLYPFIVLAFGIFYVYQYIFIKDNIYSRFIDLTLMMNYVNMMFWVAVINADLIPINKDHEIYFEDASFKAQIMNRNKEILLRNKNANELSDEMKTSIIEKGHIHIGNNILLNSDIINQNYIIWEEDHQSIQTSLKKKRELQSELLDELSILKLDVEIQKKALSLAIKNEMYDKALEQVAKEIELIKKYIHEENLFNVTLLGIILKRKLNLILISENELNLSREELFLSIQEVLNLLNQYDYNTNLDFRIDRVLATDTIFGIFEIVTNHIVENLAHENTFNIKLQTSNEKQILIQLNEKELVIYA